MATKKRGAFAIPKGKGRNKGKNQYPINTAGRARNAIARVQQFGSPGEKRMVFAAVRKRYPGIAKRSGVIATRTGSGRRYGQPKGTRNRR
jgi:hypothetical protein